jgi:hypothetical protein
MAFNAFSLDYNEVEVGGRRIYQTLLRARYSHVIGSISLMKRAFRCLSKFNALNRLISKVAPGNCLRVYLGSEFNSAVNIETSRKGSLGEGGVY